ncbi:uncharacterized protein LOC109531686 isoform X2 [Hippocampus comes]|uniref:uncharacterized protein LOC109531686 isoform X2 n=1 Tax=Hippocampus comes TaxID=109280 RepID=UPI00094F37B6|nr:PREDICTED: uncharacterized protein LOC109531686 isoform X2 [Hippocampus comes]
MLTVAVWVLALLGPVQGCSLSPPADENAELDIPCALCFYGQTLAWREGSALSPRCHKTPGGHDFATLHRPDCDTAVALAFRLGPGWTQGQVGEEIASMEKDGVQIFIPALLRGGDHETPSTDAPLPRWDWLISSVLRSGAASQCSALGGDLYVLTGVEDGAAEVLWSAACCSVPGGHGGFGMAIISESLHDYVHVKQLSVEELQDTLGVQELFSGGCGEANGGSAAVTLDLQTQEGATDKAEDLDSTQAASHSDARDSGGRDSDVTEKSTGGKESDGGIQEADETRDVERVAEQKDKADGNSSNIVVSIFSTTLSILKAPLRPLFSRITQFPGQVTYVLRKDLGVLTALPGDFFSLFYLLTSDLLSWVRWVAETLLDFLMDCIYNLYYCASSMLAALLNSCYTGVTGVGTLAGDTVGICGNALGKTWRVSKFFGGRLLRQSGDYAGTVAMEMGDQALAVGEGTGRLAWRSVAGVFNTVFVGGSIVIGVVDVVFGAFTEGFGRERETTPVHTDLSETE